MSLARRALRSTLYVALGHYTNMAVSFGATVVLARLLTPEDFGLFALAAFFFGLLEVGGKLGLDYSLMHRQEIGGAVLPTHLTVALLTSLGSIALLAIAAILLPRFGYDPLLSRLLLVLALGAGFQMAGLTPRVLLERELRFERSMAVSTAALLLSSLVAISLAWKGGGAWSLVLGQLANALLLTLGMWWLSPWRFWEGVFTFSGEVALWFLRYGLALSLGAIATLGLLQFDNFLVGSLVGIAALGFYDRAYRLAQLPTGLVTHVASRIALPVYARLQSDRERLSLAFRLTLELILTLSLPLALVLFVAAPEVVTLLLSERWLPSVPILRLLILYSVLRPLLDDVGALLVAVGRPRQVSLLLTLEALALIALATPLTLLLGVAGTALGVDAAFALGVVVAYWSLRRVIDLAYGQVFLPPLAATLTGLLSWLILINVFDISRLPLLAALLLKGLVVLSTYWAILLALERRRLGERVAYAWRLALGG